MDSNRVSQRGVELFNYADSRLGARISCDYPSTNGYEVESLICKQASSQASSQQLLSHSLSIPQTGNGFMAESFVKPPVEVTIHIPYAVSLAAIVINPRIRVHTAKVVTVFVQSSGRDRWEMLGRMVWQDAQNARPSGMCNKELGPQTILAAASQFASSICSSTSISAWTPIERQPGVLHSVKSIRLRISSMHGATILGLGGVEIWGQPSRALPPQTRTQLGTEAHQALQNDRTKPGVAAGSSQHGSSEPLADIPAEFVDVITQEAMLDPVTLPSGAVCDRSTIARHLQEHRTDPFTGLPLRFEQVKPDLLLQQRIRSWLEAQQK